MFHFDWTLNITTLLIVAGALVTFFKGFISVRDALRDLTKVVGQETPQPTGLLGDIFHMKIEQQQHRDWLIGAGLDRRNHQDRRERDHQ